MEDSILSLLKQKRRGLSTAQLAGGLHLRGRALVRLRTALKSLEKRGAVVKKHDKYIAPPEREVLRGRFLATSRGFGFVRPEGEGEKGDVFIPARYTLGALNGDVVEVLYKEHGKKGKPEGRVTCLLKKGCETLLGIFKEHSGRAYIAPLDSPAAEEIPVFATGRAVPPKGTIVEVDRETFAVKRVVGHPDEPGVDTQVVIKRFGLQASFSPEAAREAATVVGRISASDKEGRVDHRRWRTVTIDGESAQDFDDAVSIKRLPSGSTLLGVHIADVSHYVQPGSALDRDALERATSVYLPDLTLPMLPERLSNDLCSLRPREPRLTMTVLLEIDGRGRVQKARFHPSIIKTAERMTYSSVFQIFEGDEAERKKYASLVPDFLLMRELAARLRARREEQGSLNFDLLEPELIYQEGRVHSVAAFEANEAHRLIEEFMVAANEAVARWLDEEGQPSLYRVHPAPGLADLEELRILLEHFGILLPKPEKITAFDLQRILRQAEGKPEEKFVQSRVLRALRIAVYSAENSGHYGLAKKNYAHFTSPIRRYPDLVVHRALKAALRGQRLKIPSLQSLALHCSDQERKADGAEKELTEWRIFRLLKERLGDECDGLIVDISKAGLIVELVDYFVDGLVPYADLGGDYFQRKSEAALVGRRSGARYRLGDKMRVVLAAVDPLLRRMTLVPSERPRRESR